MLSEIMVREYLRDAEMNLLGWHEGGGWLTPTEPDPEERAAVRARLEGAIFAYRRVLGLPEVEKAEPKSTGFGIEVGSTWKARSYLLARFERVRVTSVAPDGRVDYDGRGDGFGLGATRGNLFHSTFMEHYEPDATPWTAGPDPHDQPMRGE